MIRGCGCSTAAEHTSHYLDDVASKPAGCWAFLCVGHILVRLTAPQTPSTRQASGVVRYCGGFVPKANQTSKDSRQWKDFFPSSTFCLFLLSFTSGVSVIRSLKDVHLYLRVVKAI